MTLLQSSLTAKPIQDPLQLAFDDNRLLTALYGEFDRNLARIEERTGASIASRGNRVAISGAEGARQLAGQALTDLYRRLEKGLDVHDADVDAAVRLAEGRKQGDAASAADETIIRTRKRQITPRSHNQARYVQALQSSELVFGLGPAGTGKTYLAVAVAVAQLLSGQVERLILCRPAVEAGEKLGFLPGDIKEKVDPYLRPLYDALYDMLAGDQVVRRLASGEIEIAPLAFMRGRTLANSFIILDEAQNTTAVQMKMLLTRMGENSRMAVTGDPSQVDLPPGTRSGLHDAHAVLQEVEGVTFVQFEHGDVVRHAMVSRVLQAYARHEAKRDAEPNT